jgi:hypothetical protein
LFFIVCPCPETFFFSKDMDDAQKHFDAAHYTLRVLGVMGSIKMSKILWPRVILYWSQRHWANHICKTFVFRCS